MMRFAFLLACLCMIGVTVWQGFAIREQRQQIRALTARLDSSLDIPGLDFQEKCAKQALTEFKLEGGEQKEGGSFLSHYDGKLKKCFVETLDGGIDKILRKPYVSRLVTDAFEGRIYAQYYWANLEGKKYWDVPPSTCKVTLPTSGEQRTCQSFDEFNSLVEQAFGIAEE
jgi:hypothetical protein